jgi:hypothetical protein
MPSSVENSNRALYGKKKNTTKRKTSGGASCHTRREAQASVDSNTLASVGLGAVFFLSTMSMKEFVFDRFMPFQTAIIKLLMGMAASTFAP